MKQLFIRFLLIIMTLQFSGTIIFVSWFKWNQESLTELFCINKDKPELKCEGKCYMQKHVKEVEQKQSRKEQTGSEQIQLIYLPADPFNVHKNAVWNKNLTAFVYTAEEQSGFPDLLFQPPC